jgi:hypothetical protein
MKGRIIFKEKGKSMTIMTIKKIKISNFKSFRDLEIELGKFNVLLG